MQKPVNLARLAKRIRKIRRRETAWQRACKDTVAFRKESNWWFWGVEVVGTAAFATLGGLIGFSCLPANSSAYSQNAYPTVGAAIGAVLGFALAYAGMLGLNLLRAPYRQRDEARQQVRKLEQSQRESKLRPVRDDISLVYDSFFSICIERFQDGTEIHRIGLFNNSSQTVSAGVVVSSSFNLNPEPSMLHLHPTYGAADPHGKFEVDPSAEFHLESSVDFIRWNPKDRTMQICYFNCPYPEKNYVYRLVRGHKYSVSLCISIKDARVETEWQVKMYVDGRRLNIDLSEIEVWGDL